MKIYTTLSEAVARSVSHTEITKCAVQSLISGVRALAEITDLDDYRHIDDLHTDRRMVDAWGHTWDGDEFRVYLVAQEEEAE